MVGLTAHTARRISVDAGKFKMQLRGFRQIGPTKPLTRAVIEQDGVADRIPDC